MGTLSLTKAGRLYWLGRYSERALLGPRCVREILDAEVDGRPADYADYCQKLGLENVYADCSDFCRRYLTDASVPGSVPHSLQHAYDNAVVLRDTIGTDTLAYIQLALNAMEKACQSPAPAVALQWMEDDIMAFRGSCYETIDDEASRSVLRVGISVERLSIYLRLNYPAAQIHREFSKLFDRLYKTDLRTNRDDLNALVDSVLDSNAPTLSNAEALRRLEALFPEL